jgi:GNAT superfamily N-acetyltransferase
MKQPPLTIRPATSADKAAVLQFCGTTWEHGDYIHEVWDDWLADPESTLLVGALDDQPVALAHVTIHEGEGWCEGIRVAPAQRGHGFGREMRRACLDEAARHGATVARLLTSRANQAMQTLLPQLGFQLCFDAAWFRAPALADERPDRTPQALTVAQLPALLADLDDARLLHDTGGLYADGWSFATPTPARLRGHLERGEVIAVPGIRGWAIVQDDGESDDLMVALAAGDLEGLLYALRAHPHVRRRGELGLLLPLDGSVARLATGAGYTRGQNTFGVYATTL